MYRYRVVKKMDSDYYEPVKYWCGAREAHFCLLYKTLKGAREYRKNLMAHEREPGVHKPPYIPPPRNQFLIVKEWVEEESHEKWVEVMAPPAERERVWTQIDPIDGIPY